MDHMGVRMELPTNFGYTGLHSPKVQFEHLVLAPALAHLEALRRETQRFPCQRFAKSPDPLETNPRTGGDNLKELAAVLKQWLLQQLATISYQHGTSSKGMQHCFHKGALNAACLRHRLTSSKGTWVMKVFCSVCCFPCSRDPSSF